MPEWAAAAGSFIGGEAGATLIIYAEEIGAALYYAAVVTTSVAYGNAQRRAARRRAIEQYNASLEDRLVMLPVVDGPRSRIYGRVRNVDGIGFKGTHGTNNENYKLIVHLCGHEIDGFDAFCINGEDVTVDGDGWVTDAKWCRSEWISEQWVGTLGPGSVQVTLPMDPLSGSVTVTTGVGIENMTTVSFTQSGAGNRVISFDLAGSESVTISYQGLHVTKRVRIRGFTGAAGQDRSADLVSFFPSLCTSSDKFSIGALLDVDLTYDTDVFPSGVPQFSARMRGARVLDPRDGQTRFTENPALHAYDWARYEFGGNVPTGLIPTAPVIVAANACDVDTAFTSPAGTRIRKLYTSGVAIPLDGATGPDRVMDDLVAAMAGRWGWSAGQLFMRAGVYRTPEVTITEDWVADFEPISVVPEAPLDGLNNSVRVKFADAAENYVAHEAPPVAPAAYVSADGEVKALDVVLGAVTDNDHAQHCAAVALREDRIGQTITLPLNFRGLRLQLFTVAWLNLPSLGLDGSQAFEVVDWSFALSGIRAIFKKIDASLYTPDASFKDYTARDNTNFGDPKNVGAVTISALSSGTATLLLQADGTIVPRIKVDLALPNELQLRNGGEVELRWGSALVADAQWETVSFAPTGTTQTVYLEPVVEGGVYIVKARARNALVSGPWSTQKSIQVVGKSQPPAQPSGVSALIVEGGVLIKWTPNTELDYLETQVVHGANPDTGTLLFKARASQFMWVWPAIGTYHLSLRHFDSSGNPSTWYSFDFSVTSDIYLQWQHIGGSGKPADNATSDLQLLGRNVTINGNKVTKTGGANLNWDADAYSVGGFIGGAYCLAVIGDPTTHIMIGLNTDPGTDAGYASIDFAIYLNGGTLYRYESGSNLGALTDIASGDWMGVVYDGVRVRWVKNGSILFERLATVTSRLFFDSSFYEAGASVSGIKFGPLSNVAWSSVGGDGKPRDTLNYDFVQGTDGWAGLSSVVDSSSASGGKAAIAPGTPSALVYSLRPIPIDVNRYYRVRARVTRDTGSGGTLYVGVMTYDSSGNLLVNSGGSSYSYCAANGEAVSVDSAWHYFEGLITGSQAIPTATADPHKFFAGSVAAAPMLFAYGGWTGALGIDFLELVDVTDAILAANEIQDFYDDAGVSYSNIA